jgi:hypothetical protein
VSVQPSELRPSTYDQLAAVAHHWVWYWPPDEYLPYFGVMSLYNEGGTSGVFYHRNDRGDWFSATHVDIRWHCATTPEDAMKKQLEQEAELLSILHASHEWKYRMRQMMADWSKEKPEDAG